MWALPPSRRTLVCFTFRLFLFPNMLDSWDSFTTKPAPAGRERCLFSWITDKFTDSTCRFT